MIEQLYVKNYVLFDQARIDFQENMSVITGETGAGKSLLIDAIGYLSGDRIRGNIVKKGCDKAVLQMVLTCQDERVIALLKENDFDIEDQLIITRSITQNGTSSVRINQQATTLSFVKKIVSYCIDMHSQMDTYSIMDTDVQLSLLDQYAQTLSLKNKVKEAYKSYASAYKEYKHLKEQELSDDELDYLTAQYNRIQEVNVQENELEELQDKIRSIQDIEKNYQNVSESTYMLQKENGVLDSLFQIYKALSQSESTKDVSDQVHDLYFQLDEIREQLEDQNESVAQSVQELDQLQAREFEIRSLLRRFGGSYFSLMEQKEELEKKIDAIIHREDVLKRLEQEVSSLESSYKELAEKLSNKRQKQFKSLSKAVESHCKDLKLEHARFRIHRSEKPYSADGIDAIEFQVSMNPGQDFSPIKDSASGGELSRFMFALKVVFQSLHGVSTLIFDEIDTGVSGKVAFSMGKKMHELSKNYQLLCITHSAAVAAWADNHYCVTKTSDGKQTDTQARLLNEQEVLEELAVMSSGSIQEESIQAAKALKERVKNG